MQFLALQVIILYFTIIFAENKCFWKSALYRTDIYGKIKKSERVKAGNTVRFCRGRRKARFWYGREV